MTYRKNWLSVCLWAFYALAVFVGYAKVLYDALQAPYMTNHYIQFGIVFLSFAFAIAAFMQLRRLANLIKRPVHVLWEALFFVLLFAAGMFLRIYFIGSGTEHAAYFEAAMVDGSPVTVLAHGAQYFYVLLLRGLFLLTGNHFMAGIILQICLQMAASSVWYLAVRRLAGRMAALVLFAGFMLMPASLREGLLYSPKMLYMLLCGIVLLMLGRLFWRQYRAIPLKWYAWLQTVLAGAGLGVLVYLDVSGAVFAVLLLFLPFLKEMPLKEEEPAKKGKRFGWVFLQTLLVLLSAALTMFLLFYLDAMQSRAGIEEIFATWRILFSYKGNFVVPEIGKAGSFLEAWVLVGLAFIMLIGVLAFFVRHKEEVQIPWLFFALAVAALYAGGFCAEGMDCEYMLLTAVLLLAGTGMQAAFCRTKGEAEEGALEAGKETLPEQDTEKKETLTERERTEEKEDSSEQQETAGAEAENRPKRGESLKEGQTELEQQSPEKQNQTESDVSQMSGNPEYEGSSEVGEQDSLWALFAGDEGTAKPLGNGTEKKEDGQAEAKRKAKPAKEKPVKEKKVKEKKIKEKKVKEKPQKAAEKKKAAQAENTAAVPKVQEKGPEKREEKKNYIENPLPLPKKHVKKTMGYGTEPAPDKMDFDIDVSEFDDFDI